MAETSIEWTRNDDGTPGKVWNPTTGCDRVSPGCDHCYAMTMAKRLKGMGSAKYQLDGDPRTSGPGFGVSVHPDTLADPLKWRKPQRIFVNSMSDLFHPRVPDGFIAQVWEVMAQCPQHTFQILTKRPKRMRSWVTRWHDTTGDEHVSGAGLPPMPRGPAAVREVYTSPRAMLFADMLDNMGDPPEGAAYPLYDWMEGPRWFPGVLPNVWLLVSAEDQERADERIPILLETPAAVRGISAEPLLGPIDLLGDVESPGPAIVRTGVHTPGGPWGPDEYDYDDQVGIDWVIVGGESGRGARPMHPDWARGLRDQCQTAGVAYLFKQWGEHVTVGQMTAEAATKYSGPAWPDGVPWRVGKKAAGRELDGQTWDQYPEVAHA